MFENEGTRRADAARAQAAAAHEEASVRRALTDDAQADTPEAMLHMDGDNSFPDCDCCGWCCGGINILCVSHEEIEAIRAYVTKHGIEPIDYGKKSCCFWQPDRRCGIWEVRPQTCRLYNCHVPRREILRLNPDIAVDDEKPLIDMHECFFNGDESDPRGRT